MQRPYVPACRQNKEGTIFFDLQNPSTLDLAGINTQSVLLCAGISNMKQCETNSQKTFSVNVAGTIGLLERLSAGGFKGVFISSSQVYDGDTNTPDEETDVNPTNVYGKQKLAVERFISENGLPFAILRPTKIITNFKNLLKNGTKLSLIKN